MDGLWIQSANKIVAIATLGYFATAGAETFEQARRCLADNLYHEARGEGMRGMVAVANVVINRRNDHHFPQDICKIIYQPKQFSWTIKRKLRKMKVKHTQEMLLISELALRGLLRDITHGSQFYHANYVKPSWAYYMKHQATVGKHRFYRLD